MKTNVVPIKNKSGAKTNESCRLSLDVCREILNRKDQKFTDEQVIRIRDYLYMLADIAIEEYERQEKKHCQVINLNEHKKLKDEKSDYLRAS